MPNYNPNNVQIEWNGIDLAGCWWSLEVYRKSATIVLQTEEETTLRINLSYDRFAEVTFKNDSEWIDKLLTLDEIPDGCLCINGVDMVTASWDEIKRLEEEVNNG